MPPDRDTTRLHVTYRITCADGEDPAARARDIAYEQTVELPADSVPPAVAARTVGRIETLEPAGDERWRAVISFDAGIVGADDVPQLLNLLFGNISLKAGIELTGLEWPDALLDQLGGPRFGIDGLRSLTGVGARRPLVCAAVKPLGLPVDALADICYRFASGGIDIIKDDHSLSDQAVAPFSERVGRCQEAVVRANRETGGTSLYFPNVTGPAAALLERADLARRTGCRGVLVSPLLVGLDAIRCLAAGSELAVMAHPSLAGVFFHERHGIAPAVLLGELFRVVGSDAVIYPNVAGRFTLSRATCEAINASLRKPLGSLKPAFPVPAGGIDTARVPEWIDRYGVDTMFLIGGSLYAQRDLARAAGDLLDVVRRHCDG